MSWLFTSGSQTIGASASASVLPMEYSGLISFRIDWFDLLESPRDSQESSPAPKFENISSLALSLPHGPTIASYITTGKKHSFDYVDLCWQNDVSVF